MQLKVSLLAIILQRLLGLRSDGLAAYHDNRVWSNSDVYLSKEKYSSNNAYLLGDLAFSASSVMVPAFKKGLNSNLSE